MIPVVKIWIAHVLIEVGQVPARPTAAKAARLMRVAASSLPMAVGRSSGQCGAASPQKVVGNGCYPLWWPHSARVSGAVAGLLKHTVRRTYKDPALNCDEGWILRAQWSTPSGGVGCAQRRLRRTISIFHQIPSFFCVAGHHEINQIRRTPRSPFPSRSTTMSCSTELLRLENRRDPSPHRASLTH
jgi:hypothetical protein